MLLLNPRQVTFANTMWEDVAAVVIDRAAERSILDWTDLGPYPVLADVPEQRVAIRVVQQIVRDDLAAPRPGDAGELTFSTAPAGADTPRRRLRAQCVVLEVSHELSLKHGALRTVRFAALSPDGAADPITTEPADGTE
ncbi:MAG: hypothetical protein IPJ41_14995 [Phycisphaerales bacterium]|nr:hypothetical protein [Phycisphaerales bacterium]